MSQPSGELSPLEAGLLEAHQRHDALLIAELRSFRFDLRLIAGAFLVAQWLVIGFLGVTSWLSANATPPVSPAFAPEDPAPAYWPEVP